LSTAPIAPHSDDDILAPRRSEMARPRRADCTQGDGRQRGVMTDALSWAGTFHGVGARILRDYADQIGLDPAFTIHDREYSADLINLVRHELGFSKTKVAFLPRALALPSTPDA